MSREIIKKPRKKRAKTYRDYQSAKAFARTYGIKTGKHWQQWLRGEIKNLLPVESLPMRPNAYYKEWKSWDHFLGNTIKREKKVRPDEYYSFQEAKRYARWAGIKNEKQWVLWKKGELQKVPSFPARMPMSPDMKYKGDWQGWQNFLHGTEKRVVKRYKHAREFARTLKLTSARQWKVYLKGGIKGLPPLPEDLPRQPKEAYLRDGSWKGWSDFLGMNIRNYSDEALSFESAKKFLRPLKIKSKRQFLAYARGTLKKKHWPAFPIKMPRSPDVVYGSQWKGWGDFLDSGNPAPGKAVYRSFEKAKSYVKNLKIENQDQWRLYVKGKLPGLLLKPQDIPSHPDQAYKDQWKGYNDFLGNGREFGHDYLFVSYAKAKAFARSLQLKSKNAWLRYTVGRHTEKLPPFPKDIPHTPHQVYQNKGWESWDKFLGIKRE